MQFKDIHGHEAIKTRLIKTVNDQRISSTQLFSGPEGCGALGLSIAYCQYIACDERSESDSCGKCASCIKFNKYAHPDLHFSFPANRKDGATKDMTSDEFMPAWREMLNKDSFISTHEWQDILSTENKQLFISTYEAANIIRKLNYKSFDSDYKFLIMWLPEKLGAEGANRLLKTFEEPFEKTLIIMVSEDYDAILKTILSRAQLLKIPAYSTNEISIMLQNKLSLSIAQAEKIAAISEGNYCKARLMALHGEDFVQAFDQYRQWMRDIVTFNITNLLASMDYFAKTGRERQKDFLNYTLFMFRQVLAYKFGRGTEVMSAEEQDFAEKFSIYIQIEGVDALSNLINDAAYHIERNANPKMVFLDLSLTLGKFLKRESPVLP
jgi:DNA polymerase-3 subunit delta'